MTDRNERLRRYWDKQTGRYDRQMGFFDRNFFGDTRSWVTSQAGGQVLEVAIGTGLNLPHYPEGIRLTGIEWSPAMLDLARHRADGLGMDADLRVGDAQDLDLPDDSFDTVICTFSLCAIPDHRAALSEMVRVLRPGGKLLLADHIAAAHWPIRALQWLLERVTIPTGGEHFRRRPINHIPGHGLTIERHDRFKLGMVERLAARKPE